MKIVVARLRFLWRKLILSSFRRPTWKYILLVFVCTGAPYRAAKAPERIYHTHKVQLSRKAFALLFTRREREKRRGGGCGYLVKRHFLSLPRDETWEERILLDPPTTWRKTCRNKACKKSTSNKVESAGSK